MDRRGFVRRAGMVVAGAAFGYSPMGCATEINSTLPCLTPAEQPASVAGMTYIKASEIGCALDCDLNTGLNKHNGGAATDDAPTINAAMAGATASHPMTLIIDGGALISGLFLPAGGYWSITGLGCGTGFFIKSGTNNDGIHNGGPKAAVPSDPGVGTGVPAPPRGSNVSLSNFLMNGNQGDGLNGDSTTGSPQGNSGTDLWYFCVNLMNLNNIAITNLAIVNSPSFHVRLSNVGNVSVSGCVMKSSGLNTDCVHFDGPANDLTVTNCDFTCGDDAIALNCPEGYTGNISRVTITNCTFNSFSMVRIYTLPMTGSPAFNIDTVTVSNCNGTFVRGAFLIGEGAGSKPHSVDGLSISNCNITSPAVLDISANFGAVTVSGVNFTPAGSNEDVGYAFARTIQYDGSISYVGSSLTLTNCTIKRTGNYAVAALILVNGSSIGALEFDGFGLQDAGGPYVASPELLNIFAGTIGQLVIGAVDSTHLTAPFSAGGFTSVGSVSGAGVLATKWEFPDSVMANGTPYLSATSGVESIKVGGVVKPYP